MIDYCSSVEASMAAKPNNIGFNIQIKINLSVVRFFLFYIYHESNYASMGIANQDL